MAENSTCLCFFNRILSCLLFRQSCPWCAGHLFCVCVHKWDLSILLVLLMMFLLALFLLYFFLLSFCFFFLFLSLAYFFSSVNFYLFGLSVFSLLPLERSNAVQQCQWFKEPSASWQESWVTSEATSSSQMHQIQGKKPEASCSTKRAGIFL